MLRIGTMNPPWVGRLSPARRACKTNTANETGRPTHGPGRGRLERRRNEHNPSPSTSGDTARPGLCLAKARHDLRTPINHILGYCEMLQDEPANRA